MTPTRPCLTIFFDYLGKELGFKARIITASSCVTIPNFNYQRLPEWAQESCLAQIEQAKPYIEKADTIFLAAMWSWQLESQEFQQALTRFLSDSMTVHTYIISQEPLLSRHPQRNQRFIFLGLGGKTSLDEDYLRTNQRLNKLSKQSNRTEYLELGSLPLFETAPVYNNQLFYYDQHHLNEVGVTEYAKQATFIFAEFLFE